MGEVKNLVGKKFGKLTVIGFVGISKRHYAMWQCVCECGNDCIRTTDILKRKSNHSCGCLAKEHLEEMAKNNVTHGLTGSRLLNCYKAMMSRCYREKDIHYNAYGKRGITVCAEWKNNKLSFINWALENGYSDELTLERRDVNGNYEPSNCRWATPKEQANNRRNNAYITIHGVTKTAQEWADQIGITERAFMNRVVYGWSEDRLLEPKNKPLKMTKAEMTKEIKYWRNLEEQGLLLRLPCKVGQTVYAFDYPRTDIVVVVEEKVEEIKTCRSGVIIESTGDYYHSDEIGHRVFLTKKEAEQALERMEKENGNVD